MEEKQLKAIVVYYSFEGNTKLMAEVMAEAIGADLLGIKPVKEMKSKGFSKYLWGGSQVIMSKKPELEPLNLDPANYDVIIIGTPVWAWTYVPPIATLLDTVDFKNKGIGLFSCHGGQNGKTFTNLRKALKDSNVVGEIDFFEPLSNKQKDAVEKARQWAKEIVDKVR
ncbi:flavodoxin family protein [Alkaliphilus peptidifermentans]|uniref:Flavodoxin n=1 Tax=Alkaliphilus peptidifermentans DSM 18978 TaxID=1120976 RepID=A0A1G5JTV2_9FIRM|nr:flavodoxin [Alkaliphilus peptidifermentans]SCY91178.1 Flavodoxin [Alkaliphilus peptidifermentans DSM 18978]